jgi:hypothetical protein
MNTLCKYNLTKAASAVRNGLDIVSAHADYYMMAYADGIRRKLCQKNVYFRQDNCERCGGRKGGMRGNENIINQQIVCDYCHAADMKG